MVLSVNLTDGTGSFKGTVWTFDQDVNLTDPGAGGNGPTIQDDDGNWLFTSDIEYVDDANHAVLFIGFDSAGPDVTAGNAWKTAAPWNNFEAPIPASDQAGTLT